MTVTRLVTAHVVAAWAVLAVVAGSAAPAQAAVGDDELVYTTGEELRVLNLGTGADTALAGTQGINVSFPSVSPDRTKITYCSDTGGFTCDLFVYDRATAVAKRAAFSGPDGSIAPVWSPNGRRLLDSEGRVFGDSPDVALYTRPISGTPRVQVPNSIGASEPDYSPGGRHIVFAVGSASRTRPAIEWELQVMTADGRTRTPLRLAGREPAWSPDGRRIAYVVTRHDRRGEITTSVLAVANARGLQRRELTITRHPGTLLLRPQWRADSRTIYYTVRPEYAIADSYLEAIDLATMTRTRLTRTGGPPEELATYAGPRLPVDRQAPSMSGATAAPDQTRVTVTWASLPEADVVGVRLAIAPGRTPPATYGAGTKRATVLGPARRTTFSGLSAGTVYSYAVWAEDASGNLSAPRTGTFRTTARPTRQVTITPIGGAATGYGDPVTRTPASVPGYLLAGPVLLLAACTAVARRRLRRGPRRT